MLIDRFLPHYDITARYHIDVDASADRAYSAARHVDMDDSRIARWLMRLRGLPRWSLTFDGMLKSGFILLADKPSEEIVFGLIGRFWTLSPQLRHAESAGFVEFNRPGFAKAVVNLSFVPAQNSRGVRVATETRVQCLCDSSRRYFRAYWRLIGPFSGLIRKEWLRLIRYGAEREGSYRSN